MFALVCTPGLPTRTNVMASLKGELLDGLLPLAEWDTVDWPLLGQHSMVAVYDRPQGGRILDAMKAGTYKLNEYDFPRGVMDPLVAGVKNIAALDQRHRAIRPDNVFFLDEAMQMVVLGDCVTAPPVSTNRCCSSPSTARWPGGADAAKEACPPIFMPWALPSLC